MKLNPTTFQADLEGTYAPQSLVDSGEAFWFERFQLYLPEGNPPQDGWPVFFFWSYGNFSCSALFGNTISRPSSEDDSFILWLPWLLLQAGIAVSVASLVGVDSERWAPGGDQYEGGSGEFDLPSPVAGRGSFDVYGGTAPDLNHHPAAGQSPAAGLEFKSPNRNASWLIQKHWQLALEEGWPLDMQLTSGYGRSAGAQPMLWVLYGPEEADASADDLRRYPSRVSTGMFGSAMTWWPIQTSFSQSGAHYFPAAAAPASAVAVNFSQTPELYQREASAIRYGTRSWEHVGGPSGALMRNLMGSKPVFIRNIDPDTGVGGSSIEDILRFVGTDANDNRFPSIAAEVTGQTHPTSNGLLLMARLREIEPSAGFHANRSALLVRQSFVDLLGSALVPELGIPAVDLVSDVQLAPGTPGAGLSEAQQMVDWQLAQFGLLKPGFDLPAESPPVLEQQGVDVVLFPALRGDMQVGQADLLRDPGLGTAVLVSLLTDRRLDEEDLDEGRIGRRGAWFDTPADRWGSLLWKLERAKRTRQTLAEAEQYAEQALEWMVTAGIVDQVTTRAEYQGERMVLAIDLERGNSEAFEHLWQGTSRTNYDQGAIQLAVQFN